MGQAIPTNVSAFHMVVELKTGGEAGWVLGITDESRFISDSTSIAGFHVHILTYNGSHSKY